MRFHTILLAAIVGLNAGSTVVHAETKEQVFWRWFEQHEDALFTFEKNQEKVFDDLNQAMNQVHRDLTFEFGPVEGGRRQFVISAGGIKAAFPAVHALHAAAPKLKRWTFIAFRPRRTPINDLDYAGKHVRARDVHYLLFADEDPKKVGIMLFLDGYTAADRKAVWGQIGFLLLDEALGEYAMETDVGAIVFQSRASKHFTKALPLAELPKDFDETLARRK